MNREGWARFDFKESKSAQCDVTPRQSGTLYIGIEAELTDGRHCFPMSTGLVHVEPGEHTVTFELVPSVDVEGRVHGLEPTFLDEIALIDETGAPLPLYDGSPGHPKLRSSIGLRDDGWFHIVGAPLGRFRLRVGTRVQLEAGEFVIERPIEIVENGPPLSIDAHQ